MGNLLAAVLPLAVGAAVSPTLLALQLIVLSSPTSRLARAWALVAGSALVLAAFSLLCATALARVRPSHGHKSVTDAVVLIASGVLLAGLAIRSRVRRPMVVNFSTLLLVLAAVHEITHSTADTTARAAAFVVLYLIVLLPVLVPVVAAQVLGDRADHALDVTHRWVGRNARTIGTVIEAVFAVYLVVKGVRAVP
jgi:integral membrane sensor domain MASE1